MTRSASHARFETLGLKTVYAGYWEAYPLMFLTEERVIASTVFGPGLPIAPQGI